MGVIKSDMECFIILIKVKNKISNYIRIGFGSAT